MRDQRFGYDPDDQTRAEKLMRGYDRDYWCPIDHEDFRDADNSVKSSPVWWAWQWVLFLQEDLS